MLVYFNPESGDVLYTIKISGDLAAPEGASITVPDDTVVDPNDHVVLEGALVLRTTLTEAQRASAQDEITAKRGRCRAAYITDLPGQDMVYLEKRTEAIEFLAHSAPSQELFPMVYSEVGVTAPTAEQVAQVWLNMNDMWRMVSMLIERETLKAANLVAAATTKAEIDTAMAEMTTALAVLGVD